MEQIRYEGASHGREMQDWCCNSSEKTENTSALCNSRDLLMFSSLKLLIAGCTPLVHYQYIVPCLQIVRGECLCILSTSEIIVFFQLPGETSMLNVPL